MGEFRTGNASGIAMRIVHHPLICVIVIALAIRLALAPFLTYDFDIYHWGVIIENIQSGNGLYELDGYYYTPTWGYILGFISAIQDAFLNIDVFGTRITELLGIEGLTFRFHTATTTTIAFNLSMKIPMIICDIVVAYLTYMLIKDRTGDERKGTMGAALWLLCPTVVYMSGVQAQFDSISALLMLLTVLLVYKDRCFLGGIVFSAAVLLKFFPAFAILVMVAYIFVKHSDDGLAKRKLAEAILGAAIGALVLLTPQIMDGSIGDTLSFILGRVEIQSEDMLLVEVGGYVTMAFALLMMVYAGYKMYRTDREHADEKYFVYVLLALAGSMLMSATPQYFIVLLPLMALYILQHEGRAMTCWILISAGTFIAAFLNNNFMLIDSAYAYLGIGSADWILNMAYWFESGFIGDISLMSILTAAGGAIYYIGMILLLLLLLEDLIIAKIPKLGAALSRVWSWEVGKQDL